MNLPPLINTIFPFLKPKDLSQGEAASLGFAPYEEIDAKKTTKLGMVLVVMMVIFGIWQGQYLLESIQEAIAPPKSLSSCYYDAVSRSSLPISIVYDTNRWSNQLYNSYGYGYGNNNGNTCQYSTIEVNAGFSVLYNSALPKILELDTFNNEFLKLNNELSRENKNKNLQQQNYNTSLFENISGSAVPVYSSTSIAWDLSESENTIDGLNNSIRLKQSEISSKQEEIKQIFVNGATVLNKVKNDYESTIRWLELKRFAISFILLAPLVWFTMRRYFLAKNTRSEFSVIWGGVALIAVILFSQVLLVFVYKILPKQFIISLIAFFREIIESFTFLLVPVQGLGFIIVPLFFGYLVYKIQKKFYNPQAVTMRAVKEGKCPRCSMKIKDSMVHCPMCSFSLRVICHKCQATSVCFAKFCEKCGASVATEPSQPPISTPTA